MAAIDAERYLSAESLIFITSEMKTFKKIFKINAEPSDVCGIDESLQLNSGQAIGKNVNRTCSEFSCGR
jgi:hypothetical protein